MNKTLSGSSEIVDHRTASYLVPVPLGRNGEKRQWKREALEAIEDFERSDDEDQSSS